MKKYKLSSYEMELSVVELKRHLEYTNRGKKRTIPFPSEKIEALKYRIETEQTENRKMAKALVDSSIVKLAKEVIKITEAEQEIRTNPAIILDVVKKIIDVADKNGQKPLLNNYCERVKKNVK